MYDDSGAGLTQAGPFFTAINIRSFIWITEYYYGKKMKP